EVAVILLVESKAAEGGIAGFVVLGCGLHIEWAVGVSGHESLLLRWCFGLRLRAQRRLGGVIHAKGESKCQRDAGILHGLIVTERGTTGNDYRVCDRPLPLLFTVPFGVSCRKTSRNSGLVIISSMVKRALRRQLGRSVDVPGTFWGFCSSQRSS